MAAFLCLWIVAATPAAAHPHVWVTARTEVVFDAHEAITGFRQQWTFDEGYSRFAVEGIDANHDGAYDREELKELAEVNISSLKEFDYFTFPRLAGQLLQRLPPKDYWLEYHDSKLTLFFTLPLAQPLPIAKIKGFTLGIYDATYYVDFRIRERPSDHVGRCAGALRSERQAPRRTDVGAIAVEQRSTHQRSGCAICKRGHHPMPRIPVVIIRVEADRPGGRDSK